MAKGKRSVALFEVIQSNKASRGGMSMRTPKWWFKRRTASGEPAGPSAEIEAPPEPEKVTIPPADCTAPAPRVPGVDLKVDPDHQRIKFNLSYTSAMVAAFTVIVAVGLAYIIGQRMEKGPAPAMAGPSTEVVRQGPVKKGVLDVTPPAAPAPTNSKRTATSEKPTSTPAAVPVAAPPSSPPSAPVAVENNGKRVFGQQYLLIQSYPDEKRATEARDLLTKNGIPCTIERNIPGWKDLYCVIGLTGFDKASGTEFDKYKNSILQLNMSFKKEQKFMSFDPAAIRWKG